jgi:hypothetical protein
MRVQNWSVQMANAHKCQASMDSSSSSSSRILPRFREKKQANQPWGDFGFLSVPSVADQAPSAASVLLLRHSGPHYGEPCSSLNPKRDLVQFQKIALLLERDR